MTCLLVSAGEVSGDRHAAAVVRELRRRHPRLACFGAGGDALGAVGVELRHHLRALAVTGLSEAMARVPAALRMVLDLAREARRRRPSLALLVDYPGAHLRLAWLLKKLGVPVLCYIAPQRWAWLPGRASSLARVVDRLAVTLPFEEPWFRARGVRATFVGHPLLEEPRPPSRAAARAALGIDERAAVLALLPGSRPNEVARHLPLLARALPLLPPGVRPLIALAGGEGAALCRALVPGVARAAAASQALAAADAALCASGSVTLEAAIAGVPAAVFYRVSPISAAVARRVLRVPWVALPNLVLGEQLLPELLQERMTPVALAAAARRLLEPDARARIQAGLARVRARLGEPGAAARVADLADELGCGQ